MEIRYEDYQGMIISVLGKSDFLNGEGVDPFLKAIRTFDPKAGTEFSTWFQHNLIKHKLYLIGRKNREERNQPIFVDDFDLVPGQFPDAAKIIEFRDGLSKLSEDAQIVSRCLFESVHKTGKRTKFKESSMTTKVQLKKEIKLHCKYILNWSWKRYFIAIEEIENFLK